MNIPFSTTFQTAWDEWLQYRKERKLPKYTPTGLKRTITHLLNISGKDEKTAILIIEQSIAQSYQGLFPLKNNSNEQQSIAISSKQNYGSAAGAIKMLNAIKGR